MIDTSYIAAAALKPGGKGPCNCRQFTRDGKPSVKCEMCHGSGTLTACLTCEGSGWNAKTNKPCVPCSGHGYLSER